MSTALTTGLQDQRSYEGSAEQISGSAPAADQVLTSVEFNTVRQVVDQHAPLINQLIANLLAVIDGSDGVTLRTLEVEAAELRALLSSNDETLDTAQERVNKIKQLLSSVESLGVVDVEGLQEALDQLQSSIDASQLEIVGLKNSVGDLNLAAISEAKDLTPVDIFIYDTRQDSDRGAWRKRCEGTSWYQEDLNTATRGSRREFPSVAVIVAESDRVVIYDADDPDISMWMVLIAAGSNVTAVSAAIGHIYVCRGADGADRLYRFPSDSGRQPYSNAIFNGEYSSAIAERSGNGALGVVVSDNQTIVSSSSNSVAMTVLSSAPVDPDTGLPIPTIAVATDGGVSIINGPAGVGTVVDIVSSTLPIVKTVVFVGDKLIIQGPYVDYSPWVVSLPSSDVTGWSYLSYPTGITLEEYNSTNSNSSGGANLFYVGGSGAGATDSNLIAGSGPYRFIGTSKGLSKIAANPSSPSMGMVAYIASTYNTGWMVGHTKLCALCSTHTSDLVGSGELVSNWDFSSGDMTGWTDMSEASGSASVVSNQLNLVNAGSSNLDQEGKATASFPTVEGASYTVVINTAAGFCLFQCGVSESNSEYYQNNSSESSVVITFLAITDRAYITLRAFSPSQTAVIESVSAMLSDEDRSVNSKGLTVYGTVQRSPVAVGTDLVAYSGFSSNNYLQQPFNPDLDFGVGAFSVSMWINLSDISNVSRIFSRNDGAVESRCEVYVTGGSIFFYTRDSTSIRQTTATYSAIDTWAHVFCQRDNNGLMVLYIDGVERARYSGIPIDLTSTANAPLTVGIAYYDGTGFLNPILGKLALLRVSLSNQTPEQIYKTYSDEKRMFQEGAQSTLYGDSDAVAALAMDKRRDILEVGTADGRSSFSGLLRVDNTSNAVSHIAAHDGLVVEG